MLLQRKHTKGAGLVESTFISYHSCMYTSGTTHTDMYEHDILYHRSGNGKKKSVVVVFFIVFYLFVLIQLCPDPIVFNMGENDERSFTQRTVSGGGLHRAQIWDEGHTGYQIDSTCLHVKDKQQHATHWFPYWLLFLVTCPKIPICQTEGWSAVCCLSLVRAGSYQKT